MQQSKAVQPVVWLTVKPEALIEAYIAARNLDGEWRKAHPSRDDSATWQFAKIECLLLPGVWEHMGRTMRQAGNSRAFAHYEKPERGLNPDGLPGYRMRPWTHTAEHAGVVWDGIRRELFGGLGEALENVAYHYWLRRPQCPQCMGMDGDHDHERYQERRCTQCEQAYSAKCTEGTCSRYTGYRPEYMAEQLAHYRVRVPGLVEVAEA